MRVVPKLTFYIGGSVKRQLSDYGHPSFIVNEK